MPTPERILMGKMNRKGRLKEGRFVALPFNVLNSPAWKHLSPQAVCIYIELRKRFNGSNNGEIALSCRKAAEVAHCSKQTASKVFKELIAHGFIKIAKKGLFTFRNATTYILTMETLYGHAPTNEWKEWTLEKQDEGLQALPHGASIFTVDDS